MVKKGSKAVAVSVDDASITWTLKAYLEHQERIVTNLNVFHGMASQQLQASSQMLTAVSAAMDQTQLVTKSALSNAGFTEDTPGIEAFTALHNLLRKERATLSNPFVDPLPIQAPALIKAAPAVDLEPLTGKQITAQIKALKLKREKKVKDPNAPARPMTAFFQYSSQQRPVLKELMGADAKPGDIQKKLQENWLALPEADKEVLKEKYRADWALHRVEVEKYNATMGPQITAAALLAADDDDEEEEDDTADDTNENGVTVAAQVDNDESSSSESDDDSEPGAAKSPSPPPPPKARASAKKAAAVKPSPKATKASKAVKAAAPEPAKDASPIRSSAERTPEKSKKTPRETAAAKKKRLAAEATAEAEAKAAEEAAAAAAAETASKSQSPEISKKRKSGKMDTPEVNKKKKVKDTPSMTDAEKAARKQKRESQFGADF